jgi:hypothetical protein
MDAPGTHSPERSIGSGGISLRNTGWKIHLSLLGAIIRKNILEYRRYPMEIVFTFLMPPVWFLPTYFLDIIRVHTLAINPLVPYRIEIAVFITDSMLLPILGVWLFRQIDQRCRIQGSLHVH